MTTTDENKTIAEEFLRILFTLDGAKAAALLSPDFTISTKGTSILSGDRTLAELPALVERLTAIVPGGAEMKIVNMVAEGDWVVVEVQGKAVTVAGEPYNNNYAMLLEIKDGLVHSLREYMDTLLVNKVFG